MPAGDTTNSMISMVLHRLGDPGGTRWADTSEIVGYLNAAQRELLDRVCQRALHQITEIQAITLVAGTSGYALPDDFAYALRVQYKTTEATLWPIEDIRALRQNTLHEQSETTPYCIIWDNQLEFFVGSGGVTQTGTQKAYLWYVAEPTEMEASKTDMDFGLHLRNVIEEGAVWKALEQADAGDLEEAEYHKSMFFWLCDTINAHYGRGAGYGGFPNDPAKNLGGD